MDKEQAKFILQSFRPDGADAADADFADALRLATEDRELGEWLANERAADASFASALCDVEIPEELRLHILAVMRGEKPNDPAMDEAVDSILFDAMSSVQPPAGLRDQILAAMDVESGQVDQLDSATTPTNVITPSAAKTGWFSGWTRIAAVAVAVVLGAFVAFQMTSSNPSGGLVATHDVQQHAGRILNASIDLDVKGSDSDTINTWLVSRDLPTPSSIPDSLQKMQSLGCKEIRLPGDIKASLVCFRADGGGMVHLIIVKNEYISDRNLPTMGQVAKKDCRHCPLTKWNYASWKDTENTFILLSKQKASQKEELLQFF